MHASSWIRLVSQARVLYRISRSIVFIDTHLDNGHLEKSFLTQCKTSCARLFRFLSDQITCRVLRKFSLCLPGVLTLIKRFHSQISV